MQCSQCGGKSKVVRTDAYSTVIIRRRRCQICRYVFPTHERAEVDTDTPEVPKGKGKA